MNKTLCLLNSPELGGAERSFLTQLGLLTNKNEMKVFIPKVGRNYPSKVLIDCLEENKLNLLGSFEYDEYLYSTSRSGKSINILNILIGLMEQILRFKIMNFFDYQKIWCNGNKVFIPVFLGAIIFRYKGTLIWHWRDYPIKGKLNRVIHILYKRLGCFQLIFIGNSCSVCEEIKLVFPKLVVHRLYNPVKFDVSNSFKKKRGVLGFAGMSAPWKGLHELYFWASLYENELRTLGVTEIAVFGSNIYLTNGEHSQYAEQLKLLQKKFPCSLIAEKGLKHPKEIFDSIDIMLHLSNKREPFGRVILESFAYSVPCISTALGGSGELFKTTELIHYSYDYSGLTNKVAKLLQNKSFYQDQLSYGNEQYRHFQSLAEKDLKDFQEQYL